MMKSTLFIAFFHAFLFLGLPLFAQNKIEYKILILGDSITAGYGVDKDEAYPALLEKNLNKLIPHKKIIVINSGVSGSTTASLSSRLQWAIRSSPQLVVIALGGNDGLRGLPVKNMESNLNEAIAFLKSKKIQPLVAGMKIPTNYGVNYRQAFEKVFSQVASKNKVPLFPFLLDGVGGVESLNLPDGIHPNSQGHQIIASRFAQFLKEHIK